MATQHSTAVRTDNDLSDARGVLLAVAYAAVILGTLAAATGAAVLLAGFTQGLGQFVLVAAAWLGVVSASPDIAARVVLRLDRVEFGQRTPRSSKAVTAAVSYLLTR